MLANFSLDETESNLARQRLFPAWMQELVKHLSLGSDREATHETGDEIHFVVWEDELRDSDLYAPSGEVVETQRELDGSRYYVSFRAREAGFYRLGGGGGPDSRPQQGSLSFAINPSAVESDLRPIDASLLPDRAMSADPTAAGAADEAGSESSEESTAASRGPGAAHHLEGVRDYEELNSGRSIVHWFLLGLLALLLLEALLHPFFRRLGAPRVEASDTAATKPAKSSA